MFVVGKKEDPILLFIAYEYHLKLYLSIPWDNYNTQGNALLLGDHITRKYGTLIHV
jgi:hypothetical protein